ncbi:alpha/beta hydrolase [Nitrospira sp.]|nr:alpha/beta hydrolase [Nitrospira sp.]
MTLVDTAGHRIAGVLSTPSGTSSKLAVLCHGFLSNKNSSTNKALTRLLAERNIASLRFDFFGQGESDGPFEAITVSTAVGQAEAALGWATSQGFREIGLVGSSFGGLVAILVAGRTPGLRCVALKCPVPDFPEVLHLEFGSSGMAEWKRTHTIPDVTGGSARIPLRYGFYEDCLRHNGYEAAARITCPTLIVQGDEDELVPLHQARRLREALRAPARLEIMSGADHGFSKAEHFHTMTGLITDWIATHLT